MPPNNAEGGGGNRPPRQQNRYRGGGNRPRGPREVRINQEAYQFLDNDEVIARHNQTLDRMRALFTGQQGQDANKQINEAAKELLISQAVMKERGLMEDPDQLNEEDEYFDEMAEDQIEGINEQRGQEKLSRQELADFDLKAQNALRRKQGRRELNSFDELWREAHQENRKFNREKRKSDLKAEQEAQKSRGERAQKNQVFEKQEWDRIEAEDQRAQTEREDSALKEHHERFKNREVEKDYQDYGDLQEQAIKDNEKIKEFRNSPEYKAERSLKPIFERIDALQNQYSEKISEYENSSIFHKIRPIEGVRERFRYNKNKRSLESLGDLKIDLKTEEINYIQQKENLSSELDKISSRSAEELSKMNEGGTLNNNLDAEYNKILDKISFLEESHQSEKDSIVSELNDLGADITLEEESIDFREVDAGSLSADEEIFWQKEEEKLSNDRLLQTKMMDLESKLRREAQLGQVRTKPSLFDFFKHVTDTEVAKRAKNEQQERLSERDKQIQREIEKYKQKILETRIKINRLTKMIEREKRKTPEKISSKLIKEAGRRVQTESRNLYAYGEEMSHQVIIIDRKSGLKGLLDKAGISVGW